MGPCSTENLIHWWIWDDFLIGTADSHTQFHQSQQLVEEVVPVSTWIALVEKPAA